MPMVSATGLNPTGGRAATEARPTPAAVVVQDTGGLEGLPLLTPRDALHNRFSGGGVPSPATSVVRVNIGHVPMDFTAIDFETANSSAASACSVGLVKVRDGEVVDRAGWLIKPPFGHDEFTEWNTRIHGIMAPDVVDAKLWSEQLDDIVAFAEGDVLVAHNAGFDMGVITSACTASYIDTPEYAYLCSLQVARKTYHLESYRLPVAAMAAGFEGFKHHDAIADAEACARIVVHAARRHDVYDPESLAATIGIRIGRIGKPAPPTSVPWIPPATAADSDAPRWAIPMQTPMRMPAHPTLY